MDPKEDKSLTQTIDFSENAESKQIHHKNDSTFSVLLLFVFLFVLSGAGYMHLARRLAYVELQLALKCECPEQFASDDDRQGYGAVGKFEPRWKQGMDKGEQKVGALKPPSTQQLNLERKRRSEDVESPAKKLEVRLYLPKSEEGKRHKRHHNMAKGVVEVKVGGKWGRICDRDWSIAEANVVCRHLGHDGAARSYRMAAAKFGDYFSNFTMSDVECNGMEQALEECDLRFDTKDCEQRSLSKMTAGVKCTFTDDCVSSPCKNGGICHDGQNSFTCDCPAGWEGEMCDVEADKCSSSPCKNNATCHGGPHDYTCKCAAGWEGSICEINSDECVSNPCQNSGHCVDGNNGYTCLCESGWEGLQCEIEIDECLSSPCQNEAECHDLHNGYRCACQPAWEGINCEINIDECAAKPCLNNATCVDGVNSYRCQCSAGWDGHDCDTHMCASDPCENNGTCHVTKDGYMCACAPEWRGHRCQNLENLCDSSPCQNNGTCHNGGDHYICQCEHGWVGGHCENAEAYNNRSVLASTNKEPTNGYLGADSGSSSTWVHIAAKSYSGQHTLTIKRDHGVLTDFWEAKGSNKFRFDQGRLEVPEEGDYYIYSQVQYLENHKGTYTTNHTVMVANNRRETVGESDHFLTCVHEMYGFPPHKTCFTAGMRKLHRKSMVYLYVPCDGCVIALDHDTTFFGLLKLN